jgi:hypothetical protein
MLIDLKPAAVEVWKGRTEFRVVNNDGTQESTVVFTGLKNLFKNSFPQCLRLISHAWYTIAPIYL